MAYRATIPLAGAAELIQRLDKSTELASHFRALARGVLSASHARVGCVDARAAGEVTLDEPLLVLGELVDGLPFSAYFASESMGSVRHRDITARGVLGRTLSGWLLWSP